MRNLRSYLLVSLLVLVVFGCKNEKDVVVKVNSDKVTTAEFKARMQEAAYYYSKDFVDTEQGKDQVLDGVIKETVMLSAARDQGFDKTEEYKLQLNNFVRQALITNLVKELRETTLKVTDEELKAAYEADKAYYDAPKEVQVAHILVLDKGKAELILEELKEGADFAVLASSASLDTSSAGNGGVLNYFGKGDMVPAFEVAAFGLEKDGDISEIVETTFGYHIIKKIAEKTGDPVSFDDVKNKLRKILEKQKFDNWYESVKSKKKIKVNEKLVKEITLA